MKDKIRLNDAMVWAEDQTGHAKILRDEVSKLQSLLGGGLTDQQQDRFRLHTRDLMRWLKENGHPHMTIIITQTHAELLEGVVCTTDISAITAMTYKEPENGQ